MACFMVIIPRYISGSVAGYYDNEGIAIFALLFTYFLWLKSVKTGSVFWSVAASLSYFYMVGCVEVVGVCMCGGGGSVHVWKWWECACVEVVGVCMCGGGGSVHVWRWWECACVEVVGVCMCGGGGSVHVWRWWECACVEVVGVCMCGGGGLFWFTIEGSILATSCIALIHDL